MNLFPTKFLLLNALFFMSFLFDYSQKNNKKIADLTEPKITKRSLIDTSNFVIIPFDGSRSWPFNSNYKPTSLAESEILNIEALLIQSVNRYDSILIKQGKNSLIIDFGNRNFKRQYIPVINNKGEKEVWVNCFCFSGRSDWRKRIVSVDDGGSCFFNFKINLAKHKVYDFYVNGYA